MPVLAQAGAKSPAIDSSAGAPLNCSCTLDFRAFLSGLRSHFTLSWEKSLDLTHWGHEEAGDEYYTLEFHLENEAVVFPTIPSCKGNDSGEMNCSALIFYL